MIADVNVCLRALALGAWLSLCVWGIGACQPDGETSDPSPTPSPTPPASSPSPCTLMEPEICDGADNNCDGQIDEGPSSPLYPDQDRDGFGDPSRPTVADSCVVPEGMTTSGGDCDDNNPAEYPGAVDEAHDGIDQDCGGTDGPQPSVGLSASAHSTLQGAIDAARDGETVWVGPGTYLEAALTMRGKAIALSSTGGALVTTVDAGGKGPVFVFSSGEGPSSVLSGLTLSGGRAGSGGGIALVSSSPTLTQLVLTGNSASSQGGGGMYAVDSSPTLRDVTFSHNWAENKGGGLYLLESTPILEQVSFWNNRAELEGGGIWMAGSSPVLKNATLVGNSAGFGGGGIKLEGAAPHLVQVTLTGNSASRGGGMSLEASDAILEDVTLSGSSADLGGGLSLLWSNPTLTRVHLTENRANGSVGGGMEVSYSSPILHQVTFSRNVALQSGGGMSVYASSPALTQVSFLGNSASFGGGIHIDGWSPSLSQVILVGNSAHMGGGIFLADSSPLLTHLTLAGNLASAVGGGIYVDATSTPQLGEVILAYNIGYNLFAEPRTEPLELTYSDLFPIAGLPNHNLSSLDSTNLLVDPAFVFYSPDVEPSADDLHLQPDSPLRQAGDPSQLNPDGARVDLGAYGGSGADVAYYLDTDLDGLYDGWEQAYMEGLTQDAADDGDRDSLNNGDELHGGTLPAQPDTDGDGWTDGAEVAAGRDALEPASQPGVSGIAVTQVPGDVASIQAAIERCWYACAIELAAGNYKESLWIQGLVLRLSGAGSERTRLQPPASGTLLTALGSDLHLSGLMLLGGTGDYGGSMALGGSSGLLEDLVFSGGWAERQGGGLYLSYSSPTFRRVVIEGNSAGEGGGMYLESSSPTLKQVSFSGNSTFLGMGGGMLLSASSPVLEQVSFSSNVANGSGGGMSLTFSSPILRQVSFSENSTGPEGGGGGMYQYQSNPTLSHVSFSGNSADQGGGMYLYSDATLDHVSFSGNSADEGAGMYLYFSNPILSQVILIGNEAYESGGGLGLYSSSTPMLTNTILAYNTPSNVYTDSPELPPVVRYCDLYASTAEANHNLSSLDPSNLQVEPGFLSGGGLPGDLHLATSSPLRDQGDPTRFDADGSRSDLGIYGGEEGDTWDRDGDGWPDWFWPGRHDQPPSGFSSADFDVDDGDARLH